MIFNFTFEIKFIIYLLLLFITADDCPDLKTRAKFKFYLWKPFQRSLQEKIFVDNVENLEACKELARKYRGLALNYSPRHRFIRQPKDLTASRDHYWNQPHLYFNCHILQCPENEDFKTMVNDTSFDHLSLYEQPMASSDYTCLPEIGLFKLHTAAETYQDATVKCRPLENHCGTLAHVASQKRTEALTRLMANYNEQQALQLVPRVYLAYVGLQYNSTWSYNMDFYNDDKENLKCFAYRAWAPGNPNSQFTNASCVALTINRTWITVECSRKLPFICEIWTSCGND